jgi:hypothetical protein
MPPDAMTRMPAEAANRIVPATVVAPSALGVSVVGGCCGTTPEHLRRVVERCRDLGRGFLNQLMYHHGAGWGNEILDLQVRGEVKAVRSIPLTAPSSAGDLQILELVKNGTIVKKGTIARFTRTLGTLIASGVPILEALAIVKNAVGNEVLAKAINARVAYVPGRGVYADGSGGHAVRPAGADEGAARHDLHAFAGSLRWSLDAMATLVVPVSAAMIALAGGSILYQTQSIMAQYPSQAYVGASVQLFASVMLLFWYVLRLLIQLRN